MIGKAILVVIDRLAGRIEHSSAAGSKWEEDTCDALSHRTSDEARQRLSGPASSLFSPTSPSLMIERSRSQKTATSFRFRQRLRRGRNGGFAP